MDLSCENFRAMIFYDFRVGFTQQQCFERLKSGFGNEALSRSIVKRSLPNKTYALLFFESKLNKKKQQITIVFYYKN